MIPEKTLKPDDDLPGLRGLSTRAQNLLRYHGITNSGEALRAMAEKRLDAGHMRNYGPMMQAEVCLWIVRSERPVRLCRECGRPLPLE